MADAVIEGLDRGEVILIAGAVCIAVAGWMFASWLIDRLENKRRYERRLGDSYRASKKRGPPK